MARRIPLRGIAHLVGVKTEDADNTCYECKLRYLSIYKKKNDAGVMCSGVKAVLCNSDVKWSANKKNKTKPVSKESANTVLEAAERDDAAE